jgi:hypothetical protein
MSELELLLLGVQAQIEQAMAELQDPSTSDVRREALLTWARALHADLVLLAESD